MDEVKQDLRVRHTKQLLKNALLKILKEKSIDKVTVTELCKVAHINRNTFYSHYRSPGELLEEIERNFAAKIMDKIREPYLQRDYATILRDVCYAVYEDRDLALILAAEELSGNFLGDIIFQFRKVMMELWADMDAPQEKLDFMYRYGVGGSYALLRHWVTSNFPITPEAMTKELLKLNVAILTGYLSEDSLLET